MSHINTKASHPNIMPAIICIMLVLTSCQLVSLQKQETNELTNFKMPELVSLGPSQVSTTGKHVEVNVPLFYQMELDTRPLNEGLPKFNESIMEGLVKVYVNRKRGADSKLTGPIRVSVFGIPVFDNHQLEP